MRVQFLYCPLIRCNLSCATIHCSTRCSLCRLIKFLSMWCRVAAFFSASGAALSQGKMNVQSACSLNTRYFTQPRLPTCFSSFLVLWQNAAYEYKSCANYLYRQYFPTNIYKHLVDHECANYSSEWSSCRTHLNAVIFKRPFILLSSLTAGTRMTTFGNFFSNVC
jgi:hypothetical protein